MDILSTILSALEAPVSTQAALEIAAALSFVNGFSSYLLGTVGSRRGYVRYRRWVFTTIVVLTSALVPEWVSVTLPLNQPGIGGFLFRAGLGAAIVAFGLLFYVLYHLLTLENVRFYKPPTVGAQTGSGGDHPVAGVTGNSVELTTSLFRTFPSENDPVRTLAPDDAKRFFGVACVDSLLDFARANNLRVFFPLVLLADERSRPWHFSWNFAAAGIKAGENVIFFAFNRPGSSVLERILDEVQSSSSSGDRLKGSLPRLFIIDCHTRWTTAGAPPLSRDRLRSWPVDITVDYADPRDPIELSQIYGRRLEELVSLPATPVRVVYDSISDFLCFADPQLAAQFLKHNLVWEDLNNVTSLYIYSRGVPGTGFAAQADQRFMEWNSNSEIELTYDVYNQPWMVVSGVFAEKRAARITWSADQKDCLLVDPDPKRAFGSATLPKFEGSGSPPTPASPPNDGSAGSKATWANQSKSDLQ